MTDFEKMTKMAEEIGELRAYVKLAREIIEKSEPENLYTKISKKIWLEQAVPLIEEQEREAEEWLNEV